MGVGIGAESFMGAAREATPNTYQAPNRFLPIVQESVTGGIAERIPHPGAHGGRRTQVVTLPGVKPAGGDTRIVLQAEQVAWMFEAIMGGSWTPTGSGPYTFSGGPADLGTYTLALPVSGTGGVVHPKNLIGGKVGTASIECRSNEPTFVQCTWMGRDLDHTTANPTYAPPSPVNYLYFVNAQVTTAEGVRCFDEFTVNFDNMLNQNYEACSTDGGLATVHENGIRNYTGTLTGDFVDLAETNRMIAGTTGSLELFWNAGANASLKVTMNVLYTGDTPQTPGLERTKQAVNFAVESTVSDEDAIKIELITDDATV